MTGFTDSILLFLLRWTVAFAGLLARGLSRPAELPPWTPPEISPADMPPSDNELYGCTSWRKSASGGGTQSRMIEVATVTDRDSVKREIIFTPPEGVKQIVITLEQGGGDGGPNH
jgi:hypothetical protein